MRKQTGKLIAIGISLFYYVVAFARVNENHGTVILGLSDEVWIGIVAVTIALLFFLPPKKREWVFGLAFGAIVVVVCYYALQGAIGNIEHDRH